MIHIEFKAPIKVQVKVGTLNINLGNEDGQSIKSALVKAALGCYEAQSTLESSDSDEDNEKGQETEEHVIGLILTKE